MTVSGLTLRMLIELMGMVGRKKQMPREVPGKDPIPETIWLRRRTEARRVASGAGAASSRHHSNSNPHNSSCLLRVNEGEEEDDEEDVDGVDPSNKRLPQW